MMFLLLCQLDFARVVFQSLVFLAEERTKPKSFIPLKSINEDQIMELENIRITACFIDVSKVEDILDGK